MDSYRVLIRRSAQKELRRIPPPDLRRIVSKISGLSQDPRPQGSEKLSGDDRYRIRQGDWRIVYGIDDESRTVMVVKIGHRREVYR
ncbi:MAG: type II toxin-antitoxin system RelE/ParE family toxin [Elusimicrobiota bacterium]